jgi:tetratricopeptide (TPR) repeat protein
VTQTKHSSSLTLNLNPPALRWLLLLPALLALAGTCFVIRWYVGNTVAEYTSTPDADGIEMARLGARWAPGNALAHWRLGSLQERNFSATNLAAAVDEYRVAVEVEPNDFRYWLELGRALEAAGDIQNGEKALRRAVQLAPSYSHPRWQYGNLLLRQGKVDEGFAELSRAAEADSNIQTPVFALVSQVFGDDQTRIARALPAASLRLEFALSLITAGKPDEALRVLQTVSAADRLKQSATVDEVIKAFIAGHHYHAALSLLRDSQSNAAELPALEQFWNGGFEMPLTSNDEQPFHWLIDSHSQAQITIDNSRSHSGQHSLKFLFKSPTKLDKISLWQTVIVEPDTQYKIEFYARTEGLISASRPLLAVKDLGGGTIATSSPPPSGTNDWQLVTLTFKTKPREEGILITFYRETCGQDAVCPIFGSVWYDDFNLQRIGAGAPAARASNR